jgi:hypothetical protein
MISSILVRDYQWAEVAANRAEDGGAHVISIHPEVDEADVPRYGHPLRLWIRHETPDQMDDVRKRLEGHYAVYRT